MIGKATSNLRDNHQTRRQFLLGAAFLALPVATLRTAFAAPVPIKVAFFGMQLINTSLMQTTDIETARLKRTGDQLCQMLSASGRFEFVPISSKLQAKMAASPDITGCNNCQQDWALEAGAELAMWGTVQKVSNLILNINVYMEVAKTAAPYLIKSVDIRGNTDESWEHGIRYLVRHYILKFD